MLVHTFAGQRVPKAMLPQPPMKTQGQGLTPDLFSEIPKLPPLYQLSGSSRPLLRSEQQEVMATGVEKTILPLSSLPRLYLLSVWTDVSTCIKWFVLRDLQAEKVLTEKQECPSGSLSCLRPEPQEGAAQTHEGKHHSALGKPALSVNTLAERGAKMHI